MKKKITMVCSLLLGAGLVMMPPMQARHYHAKYGIADREAALEKKVESAYTANELTLQESDDLKGKIKKIKDTEQKMKDKNGGKLSYADRTTLETSLNKVSEKLQKKMLAKRVQ